VFQPGLYVVIFGFLLNFAWEMFQMPLFTGMLEKRYSEATLICLKATAADVAIAMAAFWVVALLSQTRRWAMAVRLKHVVQFSAVAFVLAMLAEMVGTNLLHSYSYDSRMPLVPLLHVGLAPFLQWVFLPPVIVWLVYRQATSKG